MSTTATEPTTTHELENDVDEQPDEPAAPEGRIFDDTMYETEALRLPKIDGEGVDKIKASFAGTVWLDRAAENDVALIRDLRLGNTVTLMIEAKVGPPVPGYTTSREGDLDSLSLGRRFEVFNVYRPVAEQL